MAMITTPAIFSRVSRWSLERLPDPGSGQTQEDEDGGEAGDEDQARDDDAAPAGTIQLATETPVTAER